MNMSIRHGIEIIHTVLFLLIGGAVAVQGLRLASPFLILFGGVMTAYGGYRLVFVVRFLRGRMS
jgi:hypothetical protein